MELCRDHLKQITLNSVYVAYRRIQIPFVTQKTQNSSKKYVYWMQHLPNLYSQSYTCFLKPLDIYILTEEVCKYRRNPSISPSI